MPVLVKHREAAGRAPIGTRFTYARHPFDVVGWDGCLYPYRFNVDDFMPITGKMHQPPPAHQVFEGGNFVICNFVPRKVDYHPLSIPVPYYHSNVDSDEVMFYCGGDYEARKGSGIGPGSVSLHPGGVAHGPQPGAYERSHRGGVLRRAGRHGRHVRAAAARGGRPRRRRRPVRLDLGGMIAEPSAPAGTAPGRAGRAPAGSAPAGAGCSGRRAGGERDPDGTWRLRSAVPLGEYPPTVLASLRRWAAEDPGYPLIAERTAGGGWRTRSYGEMAAAADGGRPGAAGPRARPRRPAADPVRQLRRPPGGLAGRDDGGHPGGAGQHRVLAAVGRPCPDPARSPR